MSKSFANRVQLIRTQKTKQYGCITLDLSTARTNEEIGIQGNMIYTESLSLDAVAYLRLNEISADLVLMKIFRKINGCFYRIFLSNTAQPGNTITFYFSTSENEIHNDFSIEDYYLAVGSRLAVVDTILNITQNDSYFYESINKKSYIGGGHAPAVVQKYQSFELWNPAGSGVLGILDNVVVKAEYESTDQTLIYIGYLTIAYPDTTGCVMGCKYLTELSGSLQVRHKASNTAYPLIQIGFFLNESSNTVSNRKLNKPIIIPPNVGFCISHSIVNTFFDCEFYWSEKLI